MKIKVGGRQREAGEGRGSLSAAPGRASPQGWQRCGLRGAGAERGCANMGIPEVPAFHWEGTPPLPLSLLPQVLKKKERKKTEKKKKSVVYQSTGLQPIE